MRIFDDSIESSIIALLRGRQVSGMRLVSELQPKFPTLTKQAVYQILRRLRKEEIVVVFRKQFTLSDIFVDRAIGFFESARQTSALSSEPFLNLKDGDAISYEFKNPYVSDQFWAHAFVVLSQFATVNRPVLVYDPHQWFLVAREESETAALARLSKNGIPGLFLIGNTDPADRYVKKYFDGTTLQYHCKVMNTFANRYYFNVFGDYIIEAWLDAKTADRIDEWYKKTKSVTKETRAELRDIVNMQGKTKMRISRNKKRALKFQSFFTKDFIFAK